MQHTYVIVDSRSSGAWIVAPACMAFAFGNDILRAISAAAGAHLIEGASTKRPE
jgi:hypothetical protein